MSVLDQNWDAKEARGRYFTHVIEAYRVLEVFPVLAFQSSTSTQRHCAHVDRNLADTKG